jgi:hypothetical protein
LPACDIEKTGGPDIGYIVKNKSFINTAQLFLVVIEAGICLLSSKEVTNVLQLIKST